ncbi:hypothetical protein J4E93_006901 [Alternaria ventricosa]|uniref:uncharacterized protein n=1 Tax=Alternaria ventricosa TaxID=1187951 RepID=UPI0020C4A10F|nr:uncharacterized protein J4E93_006901 [Alternaria ventricosa]KAI4642832.1 hypothetical protein J4E93_006901 [Alternaria ventricosa]
MDVKMRPGPPGIPAKGEDWQYGSGVANDTVDAHLIAIQQAQDFWGEWSKSSGRDGGSNAALADHIARLEDVWEAIATMYDAKNFDYRPRATTMNATLRGHDLRSMWQELAAAQAEQEEVVVVPVQWLEQKLRRTAALIGIQVGYMAKKRGDKEKEAEEGDIMDPVYMSISKDDRPLYQARSGMLVRQQDIVWFPNASAAEAEDMARSRWKDIRDVLTLYEMYKLTKTEIEWFVLNHATRDVAIAWVKKLLPERGSAAQNTSQLTWNQRTDTEELWAAKLASLRELTSKANSSTVAYAAAYLDHYRRRASPLETMRDSEVDSFLVAFLEARVLRPKAGTDDDLRLRPYTSPNDVSSFAINWNSKGKGHDALGPEEEASRTAIFKLADLPSLKVMSAICAAQPDQYADTLGQADQLGLLRSPFIGVDNILSFYCAGNALYNEHYAACMQKLNAIIELGALGPVPIVIKIPGLSSISDLIPELRQLQIMVERFVESFCTNGRKCHNAVVIRGLQIVGHAISVVRVAQPRDMHREFLACAQTLSRVVQLFRKFEAEGKLDITTANSRYSYHELSQRDAAMEQQRVVMEEGMYGE